MPSRTTALFYMVYTRYQVQHTYLVTLGRSEIVYHAHTKQPLPPMVDGVVDRVHTRFGLDGKADAATLT